jgi:ribosome maturation factor RimP
LQTACISGRCYRLIDGKVEAMPAIRDEILKIVEPILNSGGYELVDLTISAARRPVIRIYIHREGGVTIDDCVKVSRSVEFELDADEIIDRRYILEVSSPGLDRPLKTERDFARNTGSESRLLLRGENGRNKEYSGIIRGCDDGDILFEVDGQQMRFRIDQIIRGKLIY